MEKESAAVVAARNGAAGGLHIGLLSHASRWLTEFLGRCA